MKRFPRYWPFVRGIHRPPVNSPHKGQWRGALMFSMICGRINGWVNNGEAGDLRRSLAHYDVIVMTYVLIWLGYNLHGVCMHCVIILLSPGRCVCYLECVNFKHNWGIHILSELFPWDTARGILRIVSQHQFRRWLGAVRWTSVDQDLWRYMAPLDHNELMHFMMTSSNGTIFRLLALCAGNSPVTGLL